MRSRRVDIELTLFRGPKPKGDLPEEASVLIRTVFTLDAMRIGIFAPELRNLHRKLRDIHFFSSEDISWSVIRKEVNELINFPEKSERTTKYVRRLPILNILLLAGFAVTAASAGIDIYVIRQFPLYVFIFPGLAFMSLVSVIRWYYEESVRSFFEKSKPRTERIRRINNQLIKRLILVLQKEKYPLEDCTFALYNQDYENLSIKKKPRIYRGYYEVYPNAKSR